MSFSRVSLKEALQETDKCKKNKKYEKLVFDGAHGLRCLSPGRDVDVLQQAGEAVRQGDAQWPQQVVPAGLHVLAGPALGVTLTAHVLVVRSHDVGDEVVVATGGLEGRERSDV